jgi:hypothetical protein
VADQDQHPWRECENQDEVKIPDAPEPTEFEKECDAEQERPKHPDICPDPQVGYQRTIHDCLSIAVICRLPEDRCRVRRCVPNPTRRPF